MKKSKGMLWAGILGAIAGLLLAPKSGKETREDLAQAVDELQKKIKQGKKVSEKKLKEVLGESQATAAKTYKEIRSEILTKVVALKKAGKTIDKKKYSEAINETIASLKKDVDVAGLKKLLVEDWERVKTALSEEETKKG